MQQNGEHADSAISNNGNVGIVALQRAVRLPHAPFHGKPVPLLAVEARSAPVKLNHCAMTVCFMI
jgi:hypothetical protein